jgi:hypothetical protein
LLAIDDHSFLEFAGPALHLLQNYRAEKMRFVLSSGIFQQSKCHPLDVSP